MWGGGHNDSSVQREPCGTRLRYVRAIVILCKLPPLTTTNYCSFAGKTRAALSSCVPTARTVEVLIRRTLPIEEYQCRVGWMNTVL